MIQNGFRSIRMVSTSKNKGHTQISTNTMVTKIPQDRERKREKDTKRKSVWVVRCLPHTQLHVDSTTDVPKRMERLEGCQKQSLAEAISQPQMAQISEALKNNQLLIIAN